MPTLRDKVRVARRAERQFGRISRAQLRELGIPDGTVASWADSGYLFRVLPHVYAVGCRARTVEADLAAALLYAGPGAMLSHATAAWWLGLIEHQPKAIHVTTTRRCRSLTKVRVHERQKRARIMHGGLPLTSTPETLRDLAASTPLTTLRRALAGAEYRSLLDLRAAENALQRGSRGAAKLRQALQRHQPALARTKSRLEAKLIELCEKENLPLPQINEKVAGWEVDALWRNHDLAVELDGYGNHHTPAQLKRDRRKEMALRTAGLQLVRYSEEQLDERHALAAELRRATAPTA